MEIRYFFDQATATFTYLIIDEKTSRCAVIDSVLHFDIFTGRTSTEPLDAVIKAIKQENLQLTWILETHAHADHLSGAQYLKSICGGQIGMSKNILEVIAHWTQVFQSQDDTPLDGSQFDHLFKDNETFEIGSLQVKVWFTPGHTPACVSYLIEDNAFVGDTLFLPEIGTARVDFPGGSAEILYDSIMRIFSLEDTTRLYSGHDYPSHDRAANCLSTVSEQKEKNIMINQSISRQTYIAKRTAKDKSLPFPKLLLPAIQFNIRGGSFGSVYDNGTQYIKIPINAV